MKNGPAIPGWAIGAVVGVFVVGLIAFGYKYVMGPGPLDPATLPKEQQSNPYLRSDYNKRFQSAHSSAPGTRP